MISVWLTENNLSWPNVVIQSAHSQFTKNHIGGTKYWMMLKLESVLILASCEIQALSAIVNRGNLSANAHPLATAYPVVTT